MFCVLCQLSDLHTFSVSYCSPTVVIEKKRITCCECFKLFSTLSHLYILYWLCVFSLQSAALQKKLHHLEGQLNNEKQVKDELEHKYRYGASEAPLTVVFVCFDSELKWEFKYC